LSHVRLRFFGYLFLIQVAKVHLLLNLTKSKYLKAYTPSLLGLMYWKCHPPRKQKCQNDTNVKLLVPKWHYKFVKYAKMTPIYDLARSLIIYWHYYRHQKLKK